MTHEAQDSDPTLWPGEKPFTDFGQWGENHLDLRVFDQDTWWVDRHGVGHRLVEMTTEYRVNVLMHLSENACYFHGGAMLRLALQISGDDLLGRQPFIPPHAIGATHLTPEAWLEATPLVTRLRALLDE